MPAAGSVKQTLPTTIRPVSRKTEYLRAGRLRSLRISNIMPGVAKHRSNTSARTLVGNSSPYLAIDLPRLHLVVLSFFRRWRRSWSCQRRGGERPFHDVGHYRAGYRPASSLIRRQRVAVIPINCRVLRIPLGLPTSASALRCHLKSSTSRLPHDDCRDCWLPHSSKSANSVLELCLRPTENVGANSMLWKLRSLLVASRYYAPTPLTLNSPDPQCST